MNTEITYYSLDKGVDIMDVGIFPARGRYRRSRMKHLYDGFFSLIVDLPEGINYCQFFANQSYEYPVDENGKEIRDREAKKVIVVGNTPFYPIVFNQGPLYISNVDGKVVEFRCITHHSWIGNVNLLTGQGQDNISFRLKYRNNEKSYWSVRVRMEEDNLYLISFSGQDQKLYLHVDNQIENEPDWGRAFKHFLPLPEFKGPAFPDTLVYQILPDRYARSDRANSSADFPDWNSRPGIYSFFGGDLIGIIRGLDRLKSMEVGTIYLNPVFNAMSYHRYDCIDFFQIDPMLGAGEDFKELIAQCHNRGIKVILDICLNHCGYTNPLFRDVIEKQDKSKYRSWFLVKNFPVNPELPNYEAWQGRKELPQFNYKEEEFLEYMKGVMTYWTKAFEIDGWRIDVCSEICPDFLRKIFRHLRSIKDDLYLIGENWHNDADSFIKYSGGNGITNYLNYHHIFKSIFTTKTLNITNLADNIIQNYYKLGCDYSRWSWNFLSNHDTPRFFGILSNKLHYHNAIVLLFALPGIPVLYYGEEAHMNGVSEIENRRTFNPEDVCSDTSDLISRLARYRSRYPELFMYGDFYVRIIETGEAPLLTLSYSYLQKQIVFYLNFSEGPVVFSHRKEEKKQFHTVKGYSHMVDLSVV